MRHVSLIFAFTLLTILMGCSDSSSSKKKSTSSSSDALCSTGNNYYCKSGCPGYSPTYTSTICAGTTTGGSTTGSTTGGGSTTYTTLGDANWGSRYGTPPKKPAIPTVSTSTFPGLSSGGYVNRGTVTMAFKQMYAPNLGMTDDYSSVVSSFFLNVEEAKGFFASDSILKLRFMPRPQPATTAGIPYCFGRVLGSGSGVDYGYTKLQFNVALKGVRPDGTLDSVFRDVKFLETGINAYSSVIDFSNSSARTMFPDGVVAVIYNVKSNQGCTGATNYPATCSAWSEVSTTCWRMDIEALVDGN